MNHGRTDGQWHGRTTRKHIASASAYWRRRLNKTALMEGAFRAMKYFVHTVNPEQFTGSVTYSTHITAAQFETPVYSQVCYY